MKFSIKELTWRSYTIAEVLFITGKMDLIGKQKFAKMIIDKNFETLVIYITV